jgi:uncharacterized membrane protein YcaP (DUF421 family)
MPEPSLVEIAARTAVIYVLMLTMIRVLGKRTIGNLTAFDMLIALIMGDLAGNAIYGQVSLAHALVAVVSLSVLHYANSWLAYWKPDLARVLEGDPTPIVRNGEVQRKGLRRERMSEGEARAELRLEGIEDLEEVRIAQVERDGRISVLREDWAEPAQKSDLDGRRAASGSPRPSRRDRRRTDAT